MKLNSKNLDKLEKLDIDKKEKLSKDIVTETSYFRWLPLTMCFSIFFILLLSIRTNQKVDHFTSNKPYIYVEKVDGEVSIAKPVDDLHRDTKVIQSFASDWIKLAFTWQSDDSDTSVSQGNVSYPSQLHLASLAITPQYRAVYLPAVNERYSKEFEFRDYISGNRQSYINIFEQPIVEKVGDGLWDVTVIADRTHAQNKSIIAEEQFNHILRIRAVDPDDGTSEIEKKISEQQDTLLYQMMKVMQSKGLQIIKITVF